MAKRVLVHTEGEVVWTIFAGELTPWLVAQGGNLQRIMGPPRQKLIDALPDANPPINGGWNLA